MEQRKTGKTLLSFLLALVVIVGLCPATALADEALSADDGTALQTQNDPVRYLLPDNTWGTCTEYTIVENNIHRVGWSNGWFVVPENTTVDLRGGLEINGDAHLILCDGATLNISSDIGYTSDAELIIYAQSWGENAGKLIVGEGLEYDRGIRLYSLIVNGGNIISNAGWRSHGIEVKFLTMKEGSITASSSGNYAGIMGEHGLLFSKGTVKATNKDHTGIACEGSLIVQWAQVEATGGKYGVYATSHESSVNVLSGDLTCQGGTVAIETNDLYIMEDLKVRAGANETTATAVDNPATWKHTEKWARIMKVTPATSIQLDSDSLMLSPGEKALIAATVKPDDATDKTVTWKSSNESVATVQNGAVTGVGAGTATITVTSVSNPDVSATCSVTVRGNSNKEIYRLYNPNSGEHFYTANADERAHVIAAGWTDEGVGWIAPAQGNPVYRLYNANGGEHHYTTSASERDWLISLSWNDEGTGWFTAGTDGVPIYRQYNPNAFACNHNFTASTSERDWLLGLGWKDESIGWYGVHNLK